MNPLKGKMCLPLDCCDIEWEWDLMGRFAIRFGSGTARAEEKFMRVFERPGSKGPKF
jgi:hypothetical protein